MNIYVSNLSFHTSEEDLKKLFEKFGAVSSAKIITDRSTGRSRGFAFVEMNADAEGNEAIKGLHNMEIEGRSMSVSIARDKPDRQENKKWNNY
ncbi:MAG: RNA-binding protein [Chitinophagaceae bacterium]|nr:RNA-binding protein [Chitinophagaceae bacterium]MBL0335892.1 RNA-binding protein [Chitinophagaceae bacterium]